MCCVIFRVSATGFFIDAVTVVLLTEFESSYAMLSCILHPSDKTVQCSCSINTVPWGSLVRVLLQVQSASSGLILTINLKLKHEQFQCKFFNRQYLSNTMSHLSAQTHHYLKIRGFYGINHNDNVSGTHAKPWPFKYSVGT